MKTKLKWSVIVLGILLIASVAVNIVLLTYDKSESAAVQDQRGETVEDVQEDTESFVTIEQRVINFFESKGMKAWASELGVTSAGSRYKNINSTHLQEFFSNPDCDSFYDTLYDVIYNPFYYPFDTFASGYEFSKCEVYTNEDVVVYTDIDRKFGNPPNITARLFVLTEDSATLYEVLSPDISEANEQIKQQIIQEYPELEKVANYMVAGVPDKYERYERELRDRINSYLSGSAEELVALQSILAEAAQIILSEQIERTETTLSQTKTSVPFGGFTWIVRVVGSADTLVEGNLVSGEYELVRVDAEGNETVVETFGYILSLTETELIVRPDHSLTFRYWSSPGEAFRNWTEIVFDSDGKEVLRLHYQDPSGEQLSFRLPQVPDAPTYTISLVTSEECTEDSGGFNENQEFVVDEVELLGIELRSQEGSQIFDLPEPQTVSCGVAYGYAVTDPFLSNIRPDFTTVRFKLPSGDSVAVWYATVDKEFVVRFD